MVSRPWGLFGGHTGDQSRLLVRLAGTPTFQTFGEAFGTTSNSRIANIELGEGDEVLIGSPGGGGYGAPELREPEQVLRDVAADFVSIAAAREVYRAAIHEVNGRYVIDQPSTHALRQGRTDDRVHSSPRASARRSSRRRDLRPAVAGST